MMDPADGDWFGVYDPDGNSVPDLFEVADYIGNIDINLAPVPRVTARAPFAGAEAMTLGLDSENRLTVVLSGGMEPDGMSRVWRYLYIPAWLPTEWTLITAFGNIRVAAEMEGDNPGYDPLPSVWLDSDAVMDLNWIGSVHGIRNGYPFGFVCLIAAISVHLARDFAGKSETLIAREREAKTAEIRRRLLEAEGARKSKELEEARRLQLSMLPPCVPEINGIQICFSMRTAAEVGGDYYDYRVEEDGTLTVAVGDATGHGMKAGILVSIIKGLFITHAAGPDIPDFFLKCSRTLRRMRLGNLYMAMMLVRIRDGKLTASSAGMPPIYSYRASTKKVDEFVIKGMPLGAVESYPYQTIETRLEPGDAVLLMSDGLPELFNDRDETFDYSRVKESFREAAGLSPDGIADRLFEAADRWRKSRKQNDDMTFVVLKIKPAIH